MSFLPTLSRIGLARHCVFPWTGGLKWPKRPSSSFATIGTALSDAAQSSAVWGDAPLDAIADHHHLSGADRRSFALQAAYIGELLELEQASHVWRKAETALAYNVRTGGARELRQRHPQDFSDVRPDELWGRPDLVYLERYTYTEGNAEHEAMRLVARDYKSGHGARGASAAQHAQLRACALAAARTYGYSAVRVELALVDEYGVHLVADDLDPFALGEIAAELSGVVRDVEHGGQPKPVPGRHCHGQYCPVAAECPATKQALAAVTSMIRLRFPLSSELESVEHAAYQRDLIKVVKQSLEVFDHAVKRFAELQPIPVEGGKVYGKVERTTRRIDIADPKAFDVLRKHLGELHADAACERATSKAAIERQIKHVAERGSYKKTLETILDELEAAGGIKTSTYTKFEEYKP